MSTTRRKAAKPPTAQHQPDWAALDALTDEEIDAQIAADPDVAPDVSHWPLDKAVIMEPVDVRAIRDKLEMSQSEFAAAFGLNLHALRDWEHQRRAPRGPARTLLQIINREPAAVRRALTAANRTLNIEAKVTRGRRPAPETTDNQSPRRSRRSQKEA